MADGRVDADKLVEACRAAAKTHARLRHGGDRRGDGQRDQRGAARHARRRRRAAVPAPGVRGRDQARRRRHQGEPCGLHRRLRGDDQRRRDGEDAGRDAAAADAGRAGFRRDADARRAPHQPIPAELLREAETVSRDARARSSAPASSGPSTIRASPTRRRYLDAPRADRAGRPRRPPDRRDRAPARARHGLRGHDPRRRAEDPSVAFRARARGSARQRRPDPRDRRVHASAHAGDRRHAPGARSGGSFSTPAGCAA